MRISGNVSSAVVGSVLCLGTAMPGVASAHDSISFGFNFGVPTYYSAPQPYYVTPPPPAVVYQVPVYPYTPAYVRYGFNYPVGRYYANEWREHEWREHQGWSRRHHDDD